MKYPVDLSRQGEDDPSRVSSEELVLLRTKRQTIEALQSSCKAVEKFWQVWQTHYLTSLREKHQREVGKKKAVYFDEVMISDPIQLRRTWKLGRITELVSNSSGITKEAVCCLHTIKSSDRGTRYGRSRKHGDCREDTQKQYNLRPNRKKKLQRNLTAAELEGESTFLVTILNIASPQAKFLEPQLQAILNSLHRQLNVATTQRLDQTTLQTEPSFEEASVKDQLSVTNTSLRNAMLTKEKILGLGTWHILTDRIYDRQVQAGLIPRARLFSG
ncbi:unnamed protein product [Cylicocyclus nassatus]|uniref:DUF5641 domain-containing protein n=1 Tax=Cylicocyclus nassatus TaxID=53992 RepID=A0AA36DUS4_CYLNA|nr:unnamed protein product [Cylicocyclus nassatus]